MQGILLILAALVVSVWSAASQPKTVSSDLSAMMPKSVLVRGTGQVESILGLWKTDEDAFAVEQAKAPTVGQIMVLFGAPSWVVFGSPRLEGTYWLIFSRPDGWLIITAHHHGALDPAHRVQFLRQTHKLPRGLSQRVAWHGFGSVGRYLADGLLHQQASEK